MPQRANFYYNNPYLKQIGDNLSAAIYGRPEIDRVKAETERLRFANEQTRRAEEERLATKALEDQFWRDYAARQPMVSPEDAEANADFRALTGTDNTLIAPQQQTYEGLLGELMTDPRLLAAAAQAGIIDPKTLMTSERMLQSDEIRADARRYTSDNTRAAAEVRADASRDVAGIRGRYGVETANARGRWGYDTQELRNQGQLATQGARNEGALATQELRNAGSIDRQRLQNEGDLAEVVMRGQTTGPNARPVIVGPKEAQAINEMVIATANRSVSDPEEYRVLIESQAEIEALAGEYFQQTRNLPMAVAAAWSEVMGYEPEVVENNQWFGPDTATVRPSAGQSPAPAPRAAAPRTAPPPAAAAGQPVVIRSPQERDALPPGTRYVAEGDPTKTVRVRQ
jgi:hypothetical protein